jgi:hypothetical protein
VKFTEQVNKIDQQGRSYGPITVSNIKDFIDSFLENKDSDIKYSVGSHD